MIRLAILRVLESYFRHRWLYLLPIALMTVVGVSYVLVSERKYIAGGIVYVQRDSFLGSLTNLRDAPYSWKSPAQETADQINELMQTNAFVRSIIQDTKLEQKMNQGEDYVNEVMYETRRSIWAQTIGDNQVGVYAAVADPVLAYELSNAVVDRFIQWQINLDQVQSGAAEDFMDELVLAYGEELETAREDLRAYLEAHPEPVRGGRPETEVLEIERLRGALDLAGQRYSNALQQQEGARLATAQAEADIRQTYFVLDAPTIPKNPAISLRQEAMNGAMFVAAGVVLAVSAVAGGALLDRSFRFPLDVESGITLPVLSVIPDAQQKSARFSFLKRPTKTSAHAKAGQKVGNPQTDEDSLEVAA